jgi:hypothetical protein
MKTLSCMPRIVTALIVVVTLTGYCDSALGQTAESPSAGEERIVVVMADGKSSVHKMTDQRVKIRTATGESEVPLNT